MKTILVLVLALCATTLFAANGNAQSTCYDFGSTPVGSTWEASAWPLGCAHAPSWPEWRLFTPGHRAPGPHPGFNPGQARRLPRVIVTYRCTGLFFLPVAIHRVRIMGFVTDQPEYACESH